MGSASPRSPDHAELGAHAVARLVAFMHTLRSNGFAVGLKEVEDAAQLMASDLAARPATLRAALKALFCTRPAEWRKFDAIFDAFWLGRGVRRAAPSVRTDTAKPAQSRERGEAESTRQTDADDQPPPDSGDAEQESTALGRMEGASRIERLADTDFRKIVDPRDIAEAHALAAQLARRMRTRLSRRERARRKGRRIDLRRTIRRNIAHGGVPIELLRRRRKRKPVRLVVLLDASGSMSLYTGVFVRFIHGVLDHFQEAEAFLFHTHLVHVSATMRERNVERALDRLSLLAQGVGGGTRIGESLATLNRWHARLTRSRTCVMIISDGYDSSDPQIMAAEMERLAKRCRRIVWLNPMIGWEGYAPVARGMQAALPHVDLFAAAHSLKSLASLEPYLARL